MQRLKLGYQIVLYIICTCLLVSCGGEQPSDLRKYVDDLKVMLVSGKDTSTSAKEVGVMPSVVYTGSKLRSPFDEPELGSTKVGSLSTPLQAYPLTVLKFVGVVSQGDSMHAFILAPDGKLYQVKEGDMIGDRYGRIISIQADKLNVMEQDESEGEGKQAIQRVVSLQLKDGD